MKGTPGKSQRIFVPETPTEKPGARKRNRDEMEDGDSQDESAADNEVILTKNMNLLGYSSN